MKTHSKIFIFTMLLMTCPALSTDLLACIFSPCLPFSQAAQFRSKVPSNLPGILFTPQRPWSDADTALPFDKDAVSLLDDDTQQPLSIRVEQRGSDSYYIEFVDTLEADQTYTLTIPSTCDVPGDGTTDVLIDTIQSVPYPPSKTLNTQVKDSHYNDPEDTSCGYIDARVSAHISVALPDTESFERWNPSIHWKAFVDGKLEQAESELRLEASCETESMRSTSLRPPGAYDVHFEGHLPGTDLTWRTPATTVNLNCREARRGGCSQIGAASSPGPLSWMLALCACLLGFYRRATI